ncbi:O-antigen/teichoic acid export membrane protein [Salinibacter ruber]|uniref:O-antigen/teichoic acid export membrane protein n=2 Tax=Salinibacter ruber TaxID=146919 RepID=A0A9X2Q1F8_9BACT|nr:O-antigen/teichoic acid export membrane protein [Salinibacter ruber]MCS3681086.1 O-antigen/teichoic acid export membrane protein [Salinibacter ruber]
MTTQAYGRYQLVVAGVGLAAISFRWLRLSLLRFLPSHKERPKRLFSIILSFFVLISLATGGIGLATICFIYSSTWQGLVAVAILLLWVKSWYTLNLDLARSRLNPRRYGWLRLTKVCLALGFGALLVVWGFGAFGPLLGLIVGMAVAAIGPSWRDWKDALVHTRVLKTRLARKVLWYGLPLTASFAVSFILSGSDRLLIGWLIDDSATGLYSAGYDITQQTITTLMSVINMAAYPLAVKALEEKGKDAAYAQMHENGTLILAIGLPATVGLIMLSSEFCTLFLGQEFRDTGIRLLPWISVGALLSGIRAYHYDLAFQLGNRTVNQVWVLGGAAVANLGLNLWLIPAFGVLGAAYATTASYAIALALSIVFGRYVLRVPMVPEGWAKVAASTFVMVAVLYIVELEGALLSLVVNIGVGGAVYLAGAYVTDLLGARQAAEKVARRIW